MFQHVGQRLLADSWQVCFPIAGERAGPTVQAEVELFLASRRTAAYKLPQGFAQVAALAAPFYGARVLPTGMGGDGWDHDSVPLSWPGAPTRRTVDLSTLALTQLSS